MASAQLPSLKLADKASWAQWLAQRSTTSHGIWLIVAKPKAHAAHPATSLTYADALEEALCWGWIDSRGKSVDEKTMAYRFTPRAPKGTWSKRNVATVERLTAEKRMHPPGLARIEAAKADGRWAQAYDQANIEPPADLVEAIEADPSAKAMWEVLTKTNRFLICLRLQSLKTAEGRRKSIASWVEKLAQGKTPQRQKKQQQSRIAQLTGAPPEVAAPSPRFSSRKASQTPAKNSTRLTQRVTRRTNRSLPTDS
ncbi:hypothetical protein KC318_g342 [Hortaea werneckii]|uniref:Bacteriocin-protection protein n=1 Tax=Hortaea werneckii TaxID=91943 RepID=A0A3M7AEY0_HORWE|nr:hypothetical protein KC334_g560 [Hortaea werneckii]KAI7027118.1 hypothetical protein KC355_g440 [Hortaea werneckii]KAI7676326.1 hypothetical protein KC318_g342 [Hortaea werneckii]RMY25992.1 hypothetical protein D0867_00345 [Hortaea werneckii]RMY41048.1 hypothetical protein D0866_00864 [Hortaea werneckii]